MSMPQSLNSSASSNPVANQRGANANALLVALFVTVISLPLAANLAGIDGGDAGAENRELAPLPSLSHSLQSVLDFGPGLSLWFNDHFGFRSLLVRWYGESRLFVLGVSPTTAVVKGADGWFFYGEDGSVEDYSAGDPLTDAALANWRNALVRARQWAHLHGAGFVFTVAPDKYVIYPEEMPSTLRRIGAVRRADQLYAYLLDLGFMVDTRPPLLEAKQRERIYQQTDTHWNERGALVAYQQIVNAARAEVPSIPPAWGREDFAPVSADVEAMDLAGMMGLKRVMRETDLQLKPLPVRLARVVEPAGAEPTAEEGRLVTEIPGSTLPRAVIFRDSFMSRLVPFLSEHFSRAVYLWQNDFDPDVVTREHPDIVIQEIVGRHLYGFIPSPELVPETSSKVEKQ
jgi:alginate O-acetyltransferase complex protein AlgJ